MNTSFSKAIIFDLDGTAIANKPKAKPTPAAVDAVMRAHTQAHVIFATGRNWGLAKELAKTFKITAPVVTLGGCQVIDPTTGKAIWEQELDPGVAAKVIDTAKQFPGIKVWSNELNKAVSLKTFKVKVRKILLSK